MHNNFVAVHTLRVLRHITIDDESVLLLVGLVRVNLTDLRKYWVAFFLAPSLRSSHTTVTVVLGAEITLLCPETTYSKRWTACLTAAIIISASSCVSSESLDRSAFLFNSFSGTTSNLHYFSSKNILCGLPATNEAGLFDGRCGVTGEFHCGSVETGIRRVAVYATKYFMYWVNVEKNVP